MFSGIVEEMARVVKIEREQSNVHFTLTCAFTHELRIDQSVAHNGVCLTVVQIDGANYVVTAMKETLSRSNLGLLQVGDLVNVERSMVLNERLDGHIVQGHVDQTATCVRKESADGSWYFTFRYPFQQEMVQRGYFTVDKGSVTVNGVSLTVCAPQEVPSHTPTDEANATDEPIMCEFSVGIIPYTFEHTNFCRIEAGTVVNLEFDIIGKYISRLAELKAL